MSHQQVSPHGGPPLELDSDFGVLEGDVLGLVERRYAHRGLAVTREDFTSRRDDGDVVCTAREGTRVVGTLTVRFDGPQGLKADPLFTPELAEWRSSGVKLCEFGSLAVDQHSQNPKQLLAQLFHLGYLHAYRRAGFERLVVEVNPRHVAFYRRWLGLLSYCSLKQHEELYRQVRDQARAKRKKQDTDRRHLAVQEAEQMITILLSQQKTPSLLNARIQSGVLWMPSSLKAKALACIRVRLGHTGVRFPSGADLFSDELQQMLDESTERIRQQFGKPH